MEFRILGPLEVRADGRAVEISGARRRALLAGRQALAAGEPDRGAELLREALGLWRGAPLEEFAWAPFAPPEIQRLEELRLGAVELRVEAELAAGRHAELVAELQRL